jgi:hypothetical protein
MAREREFDSTGQFLFTIDGGENGLVTIDDTANFKVKRTVVISANTLPNLTLEVKRVIDKNRMYVGAIDKGILHRQNISAYTIALNASIISHEQKRNNIPSNDIIRSVFSEEPTLAIRTLEVDKYGNSYSIENPFPIIDSDKKWDKIFLTRDSDKDITKVTYQKNNVTIKEYDLDYDSDKDLIEVTKS